MIQEYFQLEQYKNAKFLKHKLFFLDELIKEIVEELDHEMSIKGIHLHLYLPDEKLPIKTNREWLKKALLNIIHNAIKYNKPNGHIFIQTKIDPQTNNYFILIRDTGVGIKEEDKDKVFNKFYTKDSAHGTGIGVSLSKIVIENLGGKIHFDSKEKEGTEFYIYLPKLSKKVKIKMLTMALAAVLIIFAFTIDYFYCLIPQKIKVDISNNIKIIHFENGIVAKANKNDQFEIIAYKNLFNTRSRNKILIKKADIEIATKGNKINVIAPNISFNNLGTDFETVADNKTAISVFDGKIKSKNIIVDQYEGLVASDKIKKIPLPEKIRNLTINNNPTLKISWNSKYKNFKILVAKDINFSTSPMYEITTTKDKQTYLNIPDGKWYINVKAKNDDLYSMPVIKEFLSLNNYYKALHYYKQNYIKQALKYIKKSIVTIKNDSYKPYLLYAEILYKLQEYNDALKFLKKGEKLGGKNDLLKANIFFTQHKYNEVIKALKSPKTEQEKLLLAKAYYKLKKIKLANKYLYQILEKDPENKEALRMLSLPSEIKENFHGTN